MTVAKVVTIMGQPVRVDSIKTFPERTHFAYQMPPGSSWYCDVNFDSSGKVTSTYLHTLIHSAFILAFKNREIRNQRSHG